MHSYYPHPIDWLVILRVGGVPDAVDRESTRYLLETRLAEHDRISILLQFDPPATSAMTWSQALFDEHTLSGIERVALVIDAEEGIISDLERDLLPVAVRRFGFSEREIALAWIQGGKR